MYAGESGYNNKKMCIEWICMLIYLYLCLSLTKDPTSNENIPKNILKEYLGLSEILIKISTVNMKIKRRNRAEVLISRQT